MSPSFSLQLSKFYFELWAITLPAKVKITMWRIVNNFMPTFDNLRGRRLIVVNRCPICKSSVETIEHAMRDFSNTLSFVLAFLRENEMFTPQADLRPLRSHVNWRAPSADMVKCNFDVASCSTPHWFVADPFQAEALACLVAVKFAQDLGFTRVIVEGDSLTVIVKCRSKLIDVSLISLVVVDIKDASKFFESINFSFVHREANEVAHTLAQEGKSFNSPMY
ncbi:hypothetical protein V6N11_030636 [Hibiscus sabdariffa]|uniref:RNase H type-1 domain-containing protein n=1 Tax=Hibiscus sabdariffa TaxID=183260 RepID=A0ABR2NMD3_9ROSI